MTDRVWVGGTGGNWASSASWNPAGSPISGDTATIRSGGAVADGLTLDGLTISLGVAGGSVGLSGSGTLTTPSTHIVVASGGTASLDGSGPLVNSGTIAASGLGTELMQGGTVSNAGGILVAGGAIYVVSGAMSNTGSITVHYDGYDSGIAISSGAIAPGTVRIDGALTNGGTVVVDGGTLVVAGGGSLLGSAGRIAVSDGGTVAAYGTVASGQSLAFQDGTGELDLGTPGKFGAVITAMSAGDFIVLPTEATAAVLSGGAITIEDRGTVVATIGTTLADNALQFHERDLGFGAMLLTSDQTRVWTATSGSFTAAANWTTSGSAGAGAPLPGDELYIDSGTATLDAADGPLRASVIHLEGTSVSAPGTLLLNAATLDKSTIVVDGTSRTGQIQVSGTVVLGGTVSAASVHGSLNIVAAGSGGGAPPMVIISGAVVAAQGAAVGFSGVTVQNNGVIDGYGGVAFDSGTSIVGSGALEVDNGGTVTIGGSIAHSQLVYFGDNHGRLQIGNLSAFSATIQNFQQGDVIDLAGVSGASGTYSAGSSILTISAGGTAYGLDLSLESRASSSAPDFVFSGDGSGGTAIAFRNTDPITIDRSMPLAVVGSATQMVSFDQILKDTFGTDQLPFSTFTFSATGNHTHSTSSGGTVYDNPNTTEFWGQPYQTPPGVGIYPSWFQGGSSSTSFSATLAEIQSGGVMFEVGNCIVSTAEFSVTDPNGKEITTYHMWGVDPGASTYEPGSVPSAQAETASIRQFSQFYSLSDLPTVSNSDDCPWIGDDIAAGAGMTMPWNDISTDPNANEPGGFWRIAYNGSVSAGTVGNTWNTLLQAGDVVRMGWAGLGAGGTFGQHTTSILEVLPTSGGSAQAIEVWDDNYDLKGSVYIGPHSATYWDGTLPQTITIFRVDPAGQYLIQGHMAGETILGTSFNDLIRPVGGGVAIMVGAGNDEVQGTHADLNSSTVMGFGAGDTFDVTDLAPTGGNVGYDGASGVLTIGTGSGATTINLTAGLPGMFATASDTTGGTLVSYVACYCPGTSIAVPGGECPVERLRIGDRVVTAEGRSRPVRWVGHRSYAGRFLAANPGVQPIRIRAGALGDGLPRRDLLVSPEHAMLLGGVLIPARCLVDGDTIGRERGLDRVDYVHVELDCHDILLAEGAPSESYLDDGSRAMFHNAMQFTALYPDATAPGGYCAPRVQDGWRLDAVRRRLAEMRAA